MTSPRIKCMLILCLIIGSSLFGQGAAAGYKELTCRLIDMTKPFTMIPDRSNTCYGIGHTDAMTAAQKLIDMCKKSDTVLPSGHHSKQYLIGWTDGWGDANSASLNDFPVGTYGLGCRDK